MVLTKLVKGSQYNRNKNQYSNGHSQNTFIAWEIIDLCTAVFK